MRMMETTTNRLVIPPRSVAVPRVAMVGSLIFPLALFS